MMYRSSTKKFLSLLLVTCSIVLFGCTKIWSPSDTQVLNTWAISTWSVDTSTPQQNVPERQSYTNKTDGYSIQFPGDRTFQEHVYGSSVMFFSPLSSWDTIKENVGITKKTLDKTYTLDDYYTITKPELIKLIPGFIEISNQSIKVNDIDAKKLVYTGTQWATTLEWEQVYVIKNTVVYILTYTATEATFNQYTQKVDEMVATREIK